MYYPKAEKLFKCAIYHIKRWYTSELIAGKTVASNQLAYSIFNSKYNFGMSNINLKRNSYKKSISHRGLISSATKIYLVKRVL